MYLIIQKGVFNERLQTIAPSPFEVNNESQKKRILIDILFSHKSQYLGL